MRATAYTHVSIPALDVEKSLAFYRDLFDLEEVPAPNFGFPVRWLRVGDLQLHLFQVDDPAPHTNQHLGIEVDDFEECYRRIKALDVVDGGNPFRHVWELPDGAVQMYIRDPSDNMVEINWPDVTTLDRSLFGDDLKLLADAWPQSETNRRALLFQRLSAGV
jgi:catechol 2,3-dioxygenase-like lactoylglutathione lyase family enzyme